MNGFSEEENEIEICCQNYDKYSTVTSNDASEFIEHKENNNNLSTEYLNQYFILIYIFQNTFF